MAQGMSRDAISMMEQAARSATGRAVLLSPNPMHDTGGGQRSAQIARELIARDWFVAFVAHGRVTETVDLAERFEHPRVAHIPLEEWATRAGRGALARVLEGGATIAIGQVPVAEWLPTARAVSRGGGVSVFDLIDEWDSELGYGWYKGRVESRLARESDVLVASAPALVARLERATERAPHLLPNAFNQRIFRVGPHPRAHDLPTGMPIALYVGSLWGCWMDWQLVRHLATEAPDVAFVFVGDYRGEGGELPANCRFLGLKPQTELPGYLAHAAVAFLPWSVDAVTQATSPLKVYEFVAMGLRVVSPPLEPLAGIPGVHAAADADAFLRAIRASARATVGPQERIAMAAFSERNSWAARVDTLLALTGDAAKPGASGRRRRFPWPSWSWK